jgi:hypothetical protein
MKTAYSMMVLLPRDSLAKWQSLKSIVIYFMWSLCLLVNASAAALSEVLTQGEFSGQLHSVAAISSTPDDALTQAGIDSSARSGATAVSLTYQTAEYSGWSAGGRLQYGFDWELHDEATGSTLVGGEDDPRITVDGFHLQNLYLNYDFANLGSQTRLRVGRQDIVTPLLMRSGLFPMMDAFDGVVISNRDWSKTLFQLIWIDAWFKRKDERYGATASPQRKKFDDPVWSLYFKNTAIDNLSFEGQWMKNNNRDLIGDPPTLVNTFGGYQSVYCHMSGLG